MTIGAHAYIRRQFKLPIRKMESIEEPLARIAGNAYLMDAAATLITTAIISDHSNYIWRKTSRALCHCEISLYPSSPKSDY